ncbi:MMPL family transporter [Streptomyces chattanoogensis]
MPKAPDGPRRRGVLRPLGAWCARHFVLVIVAWLVALVGIQVLQRAYGGDYSDNFTLPGTQSQRGSEVVTAHEPKAGGYSSQVVLHDARPLTGFGDQIADAVGALRKLPDVLTVQSPLPPPGRPPTPPPPGTPNVGPLSTDGRTAYLTVRFSVPPSTLDPDYLNGVDRAVQPLRSAGVQVEYGGPLGERARPRPDDRVSEAIGFGVAVLVLLAGFGSVLAAGVPLLTALIGVICGLGVLGLIAAAFTFATVSPTLATMIGLGVGIDYALFLITRHRQNIMDGIDPVTAATTRLTNHLTDDVLPRAVRGTDAHGYVTGATAAQVDFLDIVAARLPLIIAVVVGLAFLIILIVFRGVLVAVKAAVLNVLSIAASYGVVVAVFQWGWGGPALGVSGTVPIESYVPVMMFAIIFGLSMDYEIFLLSRVHEAWLRTGDAEASVAHALEITARVITCAALITVSVFAAFIVSDTVVVKMLGLGLAVSVLIDATVVRLLLVPAVLTLLGRSAWWTPRWLDRLLPQLSPEGTADAP